MRTVRTLIVDDNTRFLDAAARLLATYDQIEIVGAVPSAREALAKLPELHPALVLMDLVMPDMNGLEATAEIKRRPFPPYVVIVTLEDTPEHRLRAKDVGADGVVGKVGLATDLLPLLRTMFPGDMPDPSTRGVEPA
jgi:DNA-binding NarL/FixJ family response regulator